MTIRDMGFWLYMICLALLSLGVIWFILVVEYHLGFALTSEFFVMDIGDASFSVQWPKGDIAFWMSSGRSEWRLWPR